jgi:archaellum component FlaC
VEEFVTDLIRQITKDLQKQVEGFESELSMSHVDIAVEAGDGIDHAHNPANLKAKELYF